jgi:DnaJ-class molecular chaperone
VAQEHAARLVWALASGGALVASAEPPMLGQAPMARLTARVRAHLRARGKLRGASAWDVLEVEPGATPAECDNAAAMLAVRYAPERTAPFDLGELAELAPLVWRHIESARETLTDTQKRAAHDLRFPRLGGDALRERRQAAEEAAAIFLRGHKALLARDAFKAVSELAAAARRFPAETDYEAYVAWAKVAAEEARKGDVRAAAIKERRQLEETLWGRRPRPRTCFALANLCRAAGDVALARLHFQEALVIDPRFAAAREALAQLPAG